MTVGASGYVLWRDESTYGMDPGTGNKTADAESAEFREIYNIERKRSLWGTRNYPKVYARAKHVEGRMTVNTSDWKLLKHTLGSLTENSGGAGSPPYYHDFEEAETLPSMTIERQFGSSEAIKYYGCKVNSCTIRGNVGEAITMELDIFGQRAEKITSGLATPSPSTSKPFVITDLTTMTIGGSDYSAYFKGFELTINNNLEVDIGGSGYPRAIDEGMREVHGTVTFKWNQAIADLAMGNTQGDLDIKVTRGTNDAVEFVVEDVLFESLVDVTEAERQKELSLAFWADYDSSNSRVVFVQVTSGQATYY